VRPRRQIRLGRNQHAKIRAEDRYDVLLNHRELHLLTRQIMDGKAEFIYRVSGTKTVWKVQHYGRELFAMYHKKTNQIITFLRPEWVEREKANAEGQTREQGRGPAAEGIEHEPV
jgi:hypothetical protein